MPRMAVQRSFPILRTRDLERLEAFYAAAFHARRTYAYEDDGRVVYVALAVGDSTVSIGLEPGAGPPEAALWIYVDDVDAAFARALERGAVAVEAPALMPWGERVGQMRDPDGMLLYLGAEASGAAEADAG